MIAKVCDDFRAKNAKIATRQASGDGARRADPGGARADRRLGRSDARRTTPRPRIEAEIKPGDFAGRYIHFGVREHGMAAAMNGIAVHGGLIPYGGTFLTFTDYCPAGDPAVGADGGSRVIYVMTHDSIGLGEDGPTHQPVEHLAALRAIPHLLVFRPADPVETAECWALALKHRHAPVDPGADPAERAVAAHATPSAPRTALRPRRLCAGRGRGRAAGDAARHRLRGVARRWPARDLLAKDGIARRGRLDAVLGIVRGSSREDYRSAVLGTAPRVAVEAAVRLRLGPLARRARRVYRDARFRRLGPRRSRSTSISASPPKPSPKRRGRCCKPSEWLGIKEAIGNI